MKQLKEFFRDKKIYTVLDVGTGSGDFVLVLKRLFPDAALCGVDPDLDSLVTAKKLYPDVSFLKMCAEKLEFADNSFDLVSLSMALHHLPEIEESISEMLRVIKSGGWIVISELFCDNLNPAQEVHKMFHHFRSKTHRILGVTHNETFKKNEILDRIKKGGIEIEFYFEFNSSVNLSLNAEELEERVEKMKAMLESVKGYPEYKSLKPQIEEFRERASEFGFQPATRVVVVGKGQ